MMTRLIVFATILLSLQAAGQDWKELGGDELFELARKEAFDGNREDSREKLKHILEKNPNYEDVRILLARTYAWDGKRDSARMELQRVLAESPKYQDAINALVDVETWDDQPEQALEVVNQGLKYYPTFGDFLYKKARLLNNLGQPNEAMTVINQFIRLFPTDKKGIELRESIEVSQQRWTIGVRASEDYFTRISNKYAFYSSVQLSRSNDWGASFLRVNYSNRLDKNGFQPEVDFYPRISKSMYAYLNYGFSKSDLFPKHRIGAELYLSFPVGLEASAGLRHLNFDNPVTLYTGSLGWYFRSMWFSFRPFVTTQTPPSGSVTMRRYFGNPNTYFEATAGIGFSPEIRQQSAAGLSSQDIYVLESQRIGAGFQYQIRYNLLGGLVINLTHQELNPSERTYMKNLNGTVYLNYLF